MQIPKLVTKWWTWAVKTDKQGTTFANREDTKWQNSSAGNIVLSIHALKHRKISAIFKLKMKNLSSSCHEKEIHKKLYAKDIQQPELYPKDYTTTNLEQGKSMVFEPES